MTDILRSEWIKLRTITVTWVLGIIAIAFPVVVATLTAMFEDNPDTITTRDVASLVTGTTIVSAMLLGVVASVGVSSEFAYGTIRPTFAAAPDRTRVLVAKPIVGAVAAVALMVVTLGASYAVATVILDARTDGARPGGNAVLPAYVGCVLLAVGLTLLGYGLGLLIRNSAAAVSILLLWPLLAEGFVGQLLVNVFGDGMQQWLPYLAGFNMAVTEPSSESFGRVGGGLYFGAWVIAFAVVGALTTKRRDA